jgi:hypothetical protein
MRLSLSEFELILMLRLASAAALARIRLLLSVRERARTPRSSNLPLFPKVGTTSNHHHSTIMLQLGASR